MKYLKGLEHQRQRLVRRLAVREVLTPVKRIAIGCTITLLVSIIAAVAYWLCGWSFSDAIYMVVITVFGVGYGEVRPITTTPLRLITIGVIVFGYAAAVYTVGSIVQFMIDGELRKILGVRRMQKNIEQLDGHVLICGFGRMGTILAQSLENRCRGILVIDNNPLRIREARSAGYLAIEGNATEDDVLHAAGIQRASVLAAVLPDDASNVFLTITAHELQKDLRIFARAEQPSTVKKLKQVGATHVISPTQIGADRLAHLILHPSTESLLQQSRLPIEINQDLALIGLQMSELVIVPNSPVIGKTIAEVRTSEGHPFLVVALRHGDGTTTVSPTLDQRLTLGDVMILMGQTSDIDKLCQRFSLQAE